VGFTYAVIIHAVPYLTGIVLGAIFLLLWGLSLRSVLRRGAELGEE
jgi:hypothetical protein